MTEVHEAASIGDLLKLEEAIKKGQDLNEPDIYWGGRTALHVACASGYKKCVYVLLQAGCNPNAKTDVGWTPAHFACEGGTKSFLLSISMKFSFFKCIMDNISSSYQSYYHRT